MATKTKKRRPMPVFNYREDASTQRKRKKLMKLVSTDPIANGKSSASDVIRAAIALAFDNQETFLSWFRSVANDNPQPQQIGATPE